MLSGRGLEQDSFDCEIRFAALFSVSSTIKDSLRSDPPKIDGVVNSLVARGDAAVNLRRANPEQKTFAKYSQ